ncbi:recombinase family protein [Halobacteriovorax sp. RZ-3]|uniref:recombinase family protein n=1 Tax=Halobacteriovorax sp. RZ-3 TaxID=3157720 RepID=UPI003711DBC7
MRKRETLGNKKAIGYIRVSSLEQVRDGESLERQREQITSFAKFKGYDLEIISDEGVSGYKGNRKGFQELVSRCRLKVVDVVIVYDLSRLSRSTRGTLAFIEDEIEANRIEFISLKNDIDTSTPMGKAFLTFISLFNQLYRDEISFKTKLALQHKKEKGEFTGGKVPYGYNLLSDGTLESNPVELEAIEYILSLYESGVSYRSIAKRLTLEKIPTKTGGNRWHHDVISKIIAKWHN